MALFFHVALNLSGKFITLSSVLLLDSVHDFSLEVITLIVLTVVKSLQSDRSGFKFQSTRSDVGQVKLFAPLFSLLKVATVTATSKSV